jgi:hypothetical protein
MTVATPAETTTVTKSTGWSRRHADRLAFAAIVVGVAVIVGMTAGSLGFTRDEGYYFKAGELYGAWWRLLFTDPTTALSTAGIDKHLSYNPEHPFLLKGAFAASLALKLAEERIQKMLTADDDARLKRGLVAELSA